MAIARDRPTHLPDEAWTNRAPFGVLREHFPSLSDEGLAPGEAWAWCPCEHPGAAPIRFYLHRIGDEGWAIGFCDAGDSPLEIWRRSKQPRVVGADDAGGEATSFIELHDPRFSLEEVLAEPKSRQYLLKDTRAGHGVMKAAEVFMLAARGGAGKSNAIVQLGVSITSNRPWFGSGYGWQPELTGPVLCVLAEEDRGEALRRLHFAIKAAGIINPDDVRRVLELLRLLPVKGADVTLCEPLDDRRMIVPSATALLIINDLKRAALAGRPYVALLLDPLADICGPDAEASNAAGRAFVKRILTPLTGAEFGNPSVGVTHHFRKMGKDARRDDESDIDSVRGASGIVNAIRWVALLDEKDDDHYVLRAPKVNYGKKLQPLHLGKVDGCEGMFVAVKPPEPKKEEDLPAPDIGLENRIRDSIEKAGPASKVEMAGRLNVREKTVARAMDRLIGLKELEEVKVNRWWKFGLKSDAKTPAAPQQLSLSTLRPPSADTPPGGGPQHPIHAPPTLLPTLTRVEEWAEGGGARGAGDGPSARRAEGEGEEDEER